MSTDSVSEGLTAGGIDSAGDDREGSSLAERWRLLADVWSAINASGETGATDRVTLDEIEREVTEAMYLGTPDLDWAESQTAMALSLIAGNI